MICITTFVMARLLLAPGMGVASTPIVSMSRAGGLPSDPNDKESMPEIHMTFQGHIKEPETAWIVDDQGDSRPTVSQRPPMQKSKDMTEVGRELKAEGSRLISRGLQSLEGTLAESEVAATRIKRHLKLLDAADQHEKQGLWSVKQGLKSLRDAAFDTAGALGEFARMQIESAESEMNLALDQQDAMQALKDVLMRMLDALKTMGPSDRTRNWLAAIYQVEHGIQSLKVLGTTGRDGCMLIKQGLALILDACASSEVMNAELAAETLAAVDQGSSMLQQKDAEQIRNGFRLMLDALSPVRQGTKLLQHGLKSLVNTYDESHNLSDQVGMATELMNMGMEDKKEGTKLLKRGLKSVLEALHESSKLTGEIAMAKALFSEAVEDNKEGTKLVKRGLESVLDLLDESNQLVNKVAIATESFSAGAIDVFHPGIDHQQEGTKLIRSGITSALDALNESNRMTVRMENELISGNTDLPHFGLSAMLDSLLNAETVPAQSKI